MLSKTGPVLNWCAQCGEMAHLITAEEAALITGVSLSAIHRQIGDGEAHASERDDGLLLICLNSLLK